MPGIAYGGNEDAVKGNQAELSHSLDKHNSQIDPECLFLADIVEKVVGLAIGDGADQISILMGWWDCRLSSTFLARPG